LPMGTRPLRSIVLLSARAAGAFVVGVGAGIVVAMSLSALFGLGSLMPFQQVIEALGFIDQSRHPKWERESVGFALVALIAALAAFGCWRARAPRALLIGAVTVGTAGFHLFIFLAFNDMNLAYDWWYFMLL